MPLSIGVQQGSRIEIGDEILVVIAVLGVHQIVVAFAGAEHTLVANEKTPLAPGLFAYCGLRTSGKPQSGARIAFEAPRNVRIMRIR